ncbi:tight adherence protein C [Catenulispora sp. MAP5-51]|uniref:type II secretion system F family protein n=1 Tax=Catenulispora sp. MAP5-51 TaxID=3156298 RepID=UPI003513B175
MITEILWGAGIGASGLLAWSGLRPLEPSLAEAQRRITACQDGPQASPTRTSLSGYSVRWLRRLGLPNRTLQADLALAGIDVEAFATRKVINAVIGLLMPVAAQVALLGAGMAVPAVAVLGVSVLFAAVFFMAPDAEVRRKAQDVRDQTREALDALLSFAATSMAAGDAVESALEGASAIGTGPAFEYFRAATAAARTSRRPVWACYADLAEQLGVVELSELAATVSLAGGQGAKIAESLAAKAASLRGRRNAERAAANISATERTHMPVSVMMLGFLLVLMFPSLDRFLTGF